MSSNSTIVLITGGNTGLGYEACKTLFQSNEVYHILIGCRGDPSRADEAIARLKQEVPGTKSAAERLSVDVVDDASIAEAFKTVSSKYSRIDVLINNAGADFGPQWTSGKITAREAWAKAWDVNVAGTHAMTLAFIPLLLKSPSPRLLFITSGISSLTEMSNGSSAMYRVPPAGWPKPPDMPPLMYRASKTGMNMMVLDWVRLLKEDGVRVWAVSPGFLATGLGPGAAIMSKAGAQDPALGGRHIRDVVEGRRDEDVGKVVRRDGVVQPW